MELWNSFVPKTYKKYKNCCFIKKSEYFLDVYLIFSISEIIINEIVPVRCTGWAAVFLIWTVLTFWSSLTAKYF